MKDKPQPISEREFDDLVDGNLSKPQLRHLIHRLDQAPQQWRQCAVALLEAQTLRRNLSLMVETSRSHALDHKSQRPAGQENRITAVRNWCVVAVSVLIAFIVGIGMGTWREGQPSASFTTSGNSPQGHEATSLQADDGSALRLVGFVNLNLAGQSQQTAPVFARGDLDQSLLDKPFVQLSDYQRQQLERQGWRVEYDRQLVSVNLANGQQMNVPFDSLRYQPIAQRVY